MGFCLPKINILTKAAMGPLKLIFDGRKRHRKACFTFLGTKKAWMEERGEVLWVLDVVHV
jgi:hypothetical protein